MSDTTQDFRTVSDAKSALKEQLRNKANVHAVAVGRKERDGVETGEVAITVFAEPKLPESELHPSDIVPSSVTVNGNKVLTDVKESEIPSTDSSSGDPQFREARHRPVMGGVSGYDARSEGSSGTIAGVFEQSDGTVVALTNRHVAVDESGDDGTGHAFNQPSEADSGDWYDTEELEIGTVSEISEWDHDAGEASSDSALIELDSDVEGVNHVAGIGPLGEGESAFFGETYLGSGRSSGLVMTEVTDLDYSGSIIHDGDSYEYEGLIVLRRELSGGDSGALYGRYDEDEGLTHPIGMHFAGGESSGNALAIPWGAIEDEHGELTPVDDRDFSTIDVLWGVDVAPYDLETNSRGQLKTLASRYGDPDDLDANELYLVEEGDSSSNALATTSLDSDWGVVAEARFSGLVDTLGTGTHDIDIRTDIGTVAEFTIEVTDQDEYRIYGEITDSEGDPISGVDIAGYGDSDN